MAWDETQPTDTTKIRNLGIVIRPNWTAIETAASTFKPQAINFTDRTVAGLAVDPTAIADAFITYCKTDSQGNSELFGINDNSDVLQFTGGAPTIATTGTTFLPGGLILKWGQISMTGTSQNFTFSTAFPTTALMVNGSPMNGVMGVANWHIPSWTATTFTVVSSSVTNGFLTYIAIGH